MLVQYYYVRVYRATEALCTTIATTKLVIQVMLIAQVLWQGRLGAEVVVWMTLQPFPPQVTFRLPVATTSSATPGGLRQAPGSTRAEENTIGLRNNTFCKIRHGTIWQMSLCTLRNQMSLCTLRNQMSLCTLRSQMSLYTLRNQMSLCTLRKQMSLCTLRNSTFCKVFTKGNRAQTSSQLSLSKSYCRHQYCDSRRY